jgi:hypothetical protein
VEAAVNEDALRQWVPIAISLVSLVLSGVALGWNVYRDVILKARVRVSVAVMRMVAEGQRVGDGPQFIRIGVANLGPGPVRIEMMVGKVAPLWRRILRRVEHFVVLNDRTNPLNQALPHKIDVGDTINLLLRYDENSFLGGSGTHIGVSDSFGRSHFAPTRQLAEAQARFAKDFPQARRRLTA